MLNVIYCDCREDNCEKIEIFSSLYVYISVFMWQKVIKKVPIDWNSVKFVYI